MPSSILQVLLISAIPVGAASLARPSPPRPPLGAHHHALLGRRIGEPDRCSEQGLRGRCPQNALSRDPEKASARRGRGKRMIRC